MKNRGNNTIEPSTPRVALEEIRLIEEADGVRDGSLNMALDELLLREWRAPWLRLYGWSAPTTSIGYFGAAPAGAERWVRRWTGGGRVEHGGSRDQTFAIGIPRALAPSRWRAQRSYQWIHAALADALRFAGAVVELAPDPPTGQLAGDACFAAPVAADLLAPDGGKLAGGAQRRCREGLLHQGSVRGTPPLKGDPLLEFARRLAARVIPATLPAGFLDRAAQLARDKYDSAAWREGRRR